MRTAKSIPISTYPADVENMDNLAALMRTSRSNAVNMAVKYALRRWPVESVEILAQQEARADEIAAMMKLTDFTTPEEVKTGWEEQQKLWTTKHSI